MFNFGGSSSRRRGSEVVSVNLPARTAEEKRLIQLQTELAEIQAAQLRQAAAEADAEKTDPLRLKQRALEEKLTQNLFARVSGTAPVLSPEEQQYLDTIYGTALQRGESDLTRFASNLAASRGMNLTDAPIGSDFLRQRRELGEGLGAQRAASALDLGNAAADFNARLAAFQEGLRQQAFQNRLALGGAQAGFTPFASGLLQERIAGRGFHGRTTGRGTGSSYGGSISASDIYGLGRGASSLGGGGGYEAWGYM